MTHINNRRGTVAEATSESAAEAVDDFGPMTPLPKKQTVADVDSVNVHRNRQLLSFIMADPLITAAAVPVRPNRSS